MEPCNLAQMAGLDALTFAIGDEAYGERLFNAARATSEADHVLAFAFSPERSPRVIASHGLIDTALAGQCAADYIGSLYLLDPHYPTIRRTDSEVAWFDYRALRNADHFDTAFLTKLDASDVIGFALRHGEVVCHIMVIRRGDRVFAANHRWLLTQIAEVMLASLHKHFSYVHALGGHNEFVMDRVLAEAPLFAGLTPRERVVCLGILTGYTSESIGINLSISVNSVLTYRKRLYDKLKISSQNELFMKMIAAMINLGRDDVKGADQAGKRSPALDTQTFGPARKFNEYYVAEAFVGDDIF